MLKLYYDKNFYIIILEGGNMKALIIGINSEFGEAITKKLNELNYNLILVSKNKKKLDKLQKEIKDIETISMDISSIYNCKKLYNKTKDDNIDLVINCEEIEIKGPFTDTKIDTDLDLIDLNIKTMHTLTKLFLEYFSKRNSGSILNICSIDAFSPMPLKSTFSASKSYILSLTNSINQELKVKKKNVYVGCYCLSNKPIIDEVENALKGLEKGKTIIVPPKSKRILSKVLPRKNILKRNYNKQV